MQKQFSFTSFLQGNLQEKYQEGRQTTPQVNSPTTKMIAFYYDLCERKKVKKEDISQWSYKQLNEEIKRLRDLPQPASDSQVEKIVSLITELQELGADVKPVTNEFISTLTGGQHGTASELIKKLMEIRQSMSHIAPPTDNQLEILVDWYWCPDIPFEEFDIKKWVMLNETITNHEGNTQQLKRRMTATEFAYEIKEKMKKNEASQFIDKYRAVYYTWKRTRITAKQIEYIQELEDRLANIEVPKQVEYAIVNGVITQITKSSQRENYSPLAYNKTELAQLQQLSYQDANTMINQLRSELEDKNLSYVSSDVYDNSQQEFEDKRSEHAHDMREARIQEHTLMQDLVFKLESIAGWEVPDLHASLTEMILDEEDNRAEEVFNELKEMMSLTVFKVKDHNNEEQVSRAKKDLGRLYIMTEGTFLGTKIAEEIMAEFMEEHMEHIIK